MVRWSTKDDWQRQAAVEVAGRCLRSDLQGWPRHSATRQCLVMAPGIAVCTHARPPAGPVRRAPGDSGAALSKGLWHNSVCMPYRRNWGAIRTPDALVDNEHLNIAASGQNFPTSSVGFHQRSWYAW